MIALDGNGGVVVGAKVVGAMRAFVLATLLLTGAIVIAGAAGCSSGLPEPESPQAQLYARECGTCHVAYPPYMLKPAMWEMQMGRMALLRRQRGLPPLSSQDEQVILAYLTKHAG